MAKVATRFWLCLPPLVLCGLDVALTLAGQPPAYWEGNCSAVQELNPLAGILLAHHPKTFAFGVLVWVSAFSLAVLLLPRWAALPVAFAVAFGHAIGAASWLVRLGAPGWALVVLLFWSAERFIRLSWTRGQR